jgi:hypothetical protein
MLSCVQVAPSSIEATTPPPNPPANTWLAELTASEVTGLVKLALTEVQVVPSVERKIPLEAVPAKRWSLAVAARA